MDSVNMDAIAPKRLIETCYHEAGHVVVCYFLGRRFTKVTIKREGNTLGRCVTAGFRGGGLDIGIEKYRYRYEIIIMVNLAGPEAALIYKGHRRFPSHRLLLPDYRDSYLIAGSMAFMDDEEAEFHVKWLRYRTRKLLSKPYVWGAVEALAKELLTRETIQWKEACQLISAAAAGVGRPRLILKPRSSS